MAVGIEIYDRLAKHGSTIKALGIPDRITHHARLKVAAAFVNDSGTKTVLDFGCGFGDLWPYLREDIAYTGTDNRREMLSEAKRRYPGDLRAFVDFDSIAGKTFDTVVCLGVLSTVKDFELDRFMSMIGNIANKHLVISWLPKLRGMKEYKGVFNTHRHNNVTAGWIERGARDAAGETTVFLVKP